MDFFDLTFAVKARDRAILDGVSGAVPAGELLAILGPSGAGKTTLLKLLTGQATPCAGRVTLSGRPIDDGARTQIGVVPQEDHLLGTLTVRETISFSARLRLPGAMPAAAKAARVDRIVATLGLEQVAHSRVRKVSGGEKKRCSIGMELVHQPPLLALDEPTSGLDSSIALRLVKTLRALARGEGPSDGSAHARKTTVVCTIHQPSARIVGLLDRLLVLTPHGTVMYNNKASEVVQRLAQAGFVCPQYENPCEFLLDLAVDDAASGTLAALVVDQQRGAPPAVHTATDDGAMPPGTPISWTAQGWVLFERAWRNNLRHPVSFYATMGRSLTMGLIVGGLYGRASELTQAGVQDRTGALFYMLVNQVFSAQASLRVFLEDRAVYLRERRSRAVHPLFYFTSRSTAELPLQLLFTGVFCGVSYPLVGLQAQWANFGMFLATLGLATLVAEALIVAVGAAAPDDRTAAVFGPVINAIMLLFGGFLINTGSLPESVAWLGNLSVHKYAFRLLMRNEFRGLEFTCLDSERRPKTLLTRKAGPCPVAFGEDHLARLQLDDTSDWDDLTALVVMLAACRLLGFLGLLYRTRKLEQADASTALPPATRPGPDGKHKKS